MSRVPPEIPIPAEAGDYLWDRSGPVDPEIAHLESLLAPYRARAGASETPKPPPKLVEPPAMPSPVRTGRVGRGFIAAAAMLLLAASAATLAWRPAPSWPVAAIAGAPAGAGDGRLRVGEWMHTDDGSRARLQVAELGEIDIEPGSRLRIKEAGASRKLLELARGEIHARIVAPPEVFLVDTPWARAVDLGCEYTLTVAPDGAGVLRVDLGYVMLTGHGRESTVPMDGGVCLVRPGHGPGTPFFDDAPPRLKEEVERLDFGGESEGSLSVVLAEARSRDALTLWHLLWRTAGPDREAVLDRLASLKPIPDGLTREQLLALDRAALKTWWDDMRPF